MPGPFRHRFRVKFDNVDYARVLYFPRQIDIYIEALEAFCMEELGLSFRKMLDVDRVAMPTVHIEVDYLLPLRFEEEAEIEVDIVAIGEKSVTFDYRVFRLPDRAMTSRARQVVVMVDDQTWQSIPVPQAYRAALQGRLLPAGPQGPQKGKRTDSAEH